MAQLVKTVMGVAIASVKTVDNLAIASVKTIMGVDNTSGGSTPTFFGSAANNASETSGNDTLTIVPPASMVSGDLVVVVAYQRGNFAQSINNSGGQTWTTESEHRYVGGSTYLYWCVFNGTWSANPTFDSAATADCFVAEMMVFRSGASTWAVDVTPTFSTYSAPAVDLVTVPGITTVTNNAVIIFVTSAEDNTQWAVQTAGWTANPAYVVSGNGSDGGMSMVYRIQETAGATGDMVNQQTTLGPDAGAYYRIAFKP